MSFLRFLLFAGAIVLLPNLYLATRVIKPLRVGSRMKRGLYVVLGLAIPGSIGVLYAARDGSLAGWMAACWIVWTYWAFLSVLLAFTLARDLGLLLHWIAGKLRRQPETPESTSRRAFLTHATSAGAAAIGGVSVGVGTAQARSGPVVEEITIPLPNLPEAFEGFRIAQISDVHVGLTIDADFISPIVDQVQALSPDLIAATGDFVDGSVATLRDEVAPLADLSAPEGVYFVTGNHEYYSGADEWTREFTRLGMRVLENEHVVLRRGDGELVIAGVPDIGSSRRSGVASDPAAAMVGAPAEAPKILLAHQPRSAFDAARAGFDLQLSGHTHAGQFFPWNLVVGLVHPVSRGLGRVRGMLVYVNRGTGYWGPPVRTMVPPEITLITLTRR